MAFGWPHTKKGQHLFGVERVVIVCRFLFPVCHPKMQPVILVDSPWKCYASLVLPGDSVSEKACMVSISWLDTLEIRHLVVTYKTHGIMLRRYNSSLDDISNLVP